MLLKKLKLTNFRNISTLELSFSPTTLFIGKNAQGKSNILESIYFLATTKSSRAQIDMQLIKQGEEFSRVEGEVVESLQSKDQEVAEVTKLEIAMQLRSDAAVEGARVVEKRVKVNGIPRRVTDYIGNLVAVYFSPEDINLVSGPPALRRWHLDLSLAQIDKQYKQALNEYSLALVSRNRLLKRIKEGLAKISELEFWTEKMIESGKVITEKRHHFFQVINEEATQLNSLTNSLGEFKYMYQQSLLSLKRLEEYQPREIAAATSLIGPHRDDFTFILNGRHLGSFGSRGEQRTAVLWLKLAQLQFINKVKQTKPILLLDDVFSELDSEHRDYIISLVKDQQTVITAVENEQIPEEFLKSVKVIRVEKGNLSVL
ncbi:MAG: DNA replication and repair protein RecF [Patescibacteria group bacterium]|nr:DNA replication and repair protein RecF [Patescibacteria group bacterium]